MSTRLPARVVLSSGASEAWFSGGPSENSMPDQWETGAPVDLSWMARQVGGAVPEKVWVVWMVSGQERVRAMAGEWAAQIASVASLQMATATLSRRTAEMAWLGCRATARNDGILIYITTEKSLALLEGETPALEPRK